jgi:hypothetical protein
MWKYYHGGMTLFIPGMAIQDGDILYFTCEAGGIPDVLHELDVTSMSYQDASLPLRTDFKTDYILNDNCEFAGFLEQQHFFWEAIDGCGNTSEFSFTARVNDYQPPIILDVPDIACIEDPLLDLVDAQDNCSEVSLRYWDVPMTNPCGDGTAMRRTYEAVDGCGNMSRDTAILIPDDDLPPVLYFVNPHLAGMQEGDTVKVECNLANGNYTSFGAHDIGVSDTCRDGMDITFSEEFISSGDCLQDRTVAFVKLNWLVIDQCGNYQSVSLIGLVRDHTPPVMVEYVPEISVSCIDSILSPEAWDNCSTASVYHQDDIIPGPCAFKYDIKRLITATDQCGNSATFSQLIHVGDDDGPRIEGIEEEICDDLSIPSVSAFDLCAGVSVAVSMHQDTILDACPDGLVITRTWTAVDLCDDTTSIIQRIIIGDTIPPRAIIPANSIIHDLISGDSIAIIYLSQTDLMDELLDLDTFSIGVLDNCDLEIDPVFTTIITPSLNPLADGYMEQRYYSWIASDICGNTTSIAFTLRVVDDIPPVVELPGDTVIYCSLLPPPVDMLPEDTLELIQTGYTEVITEGQQEGEFIVIRTWTFTDMSGNVTTASQRIRWIPDTFLECNIVPPHVVLCNSHNVLVRSEVTAGIGPLTYWWTIEGEKCFIQSGQGTPELLIYVGWAPVTVTLYVTDVYGCVTSCETTLNCQVGDSGIAELNQSPGNPLLASNDKVEVWPNPTQGEINMQFNFAEKQTCTITLVNYLGETVLNRQIEILDGTFDYHLDLSGLSDGPYFMDIRSRDYQDSRKIMLLNK